MARQKSRRLTLLEPCGARMCESIWRLSFGTLPAGTLGDCDYEKRKIVVRSLLTSEERYWTAMHEALHVACPGLMEEYILALEHNLRQMDAVLCLEGLREEL